MEFFGNDTNYPYRLLELPKNYNYDELRSQYKKMILRYHPDKRTNANDIKRTKEFNILTMCYKYLLHLLKLPDHLREGNKSTKVKPSSTNSSHTHNNHGGVGGAADFIDLKKNFELNDTSFSREQVDPEKIKQMVKNFDNDKFNQKYEKLKYNDPITSVSYQDILNQDVKHNYENNGYDAIHKTFAPDPLDGVEWSECYPLGGQNENLGRTNVISGNNGLHYMDLKIAHTTSQSVDLNKVKERPEYKTIEQLQKDRENLQFTSQEQARMKQDELYYQQQETKRLRQLSQQEKQIQEHFMKSQHELLSS
jgi:hypothetical protein